MKALRNKVNVTAPDGTYIYGKLRNNPGDNTGTPVDEELFNDSMQLFEAVMADAGITPNNLPDNLTNGFQLYNAFIEFVRNKQATLTQKGTAELATDAETITGTDTDRIVTPSNLDAWYEANFNQPWVLRSNVADVVVTGGTGTTVTLSNIKYKIIGKTMIMNFKGSITNTTAPSSFTIKIPASKVVNTGFTISPCTFILDGTLAKRAQFQVADGATTIACSIIGGDTLTNTFTTSFSYSLTFEIA